MIESYQYEKSNHNLNHPVAGGTMMAMEEIHGFDPSIASIAERYGGCRGLKELFFRVESVLWPHDFLHQDPEFGMRAAATNGALIPSQVAFKRNVKYEMGLVESRIGSQGFGPNIWIGDDEPVFKFVSFAPTAIGSDSRIRDGLIVSPRDMKRLEADDSALIKSVMEDTGCKIHISEEGFMKSIGRLIFGLPKKLLRRPRGLSRSSL
jgi:hypothetical protein